MLGTAVWRGGLGLDFSPPLGPSARPLRAEQTSTVHVGTGSRLETVPPQVRAIVYSISLLFKFQILKDYSFCFRGQLLTLATTCFINYLEVPACPFQLVYLPDHLACCISISPQDYITLSAPSGITLWQGIWRGNCPFLFSF